MRLSLLARPLTSPNCASTQVINNDDVIKNYRGRRDAVTSVAGSIPIRARDLGTTQSAALGTATHHAPSFKLDCTLGTRCPNTTLLDSTQDTYDKKMY